MERSDAVQTIGAVFVGALLVTAGVGLGQFAGSPAEPAQASSHGVDDGSDDSTITVSATGTTSAGADRALVRLSVEHTSEDPTEARTAVAENVSAMRSALSEIGIEESQIRTVDFDLYRDDRHRPGPEGEGGPVYRAEHALVIEVEDVERVGEVVDVAIDNGASNVHGVEFTVSEETREELRQEALREAMTKADRRAGTLAESSGLQVTGTRTVSTDAEVRPHRAVALEAAAGGGGSTEISSGPVGVTVTVQVTYEASEAETAS